MKKPARTLDAQAYALTLIQQQVDAISQLSDTIDSSFQDCVDAILACRGHVITTGVGKSGIIAQKLAATLASTGTPSFNLHPTDGLHGDVGAIKDGDLLIAISNSGQSKELINLIHGIQHKCSIPMIAMTQSTTSKLGRLCQLHLKLPQVQEACHLGLAPSSSTTCCMILGDTLALTLSKIKALTAESFSSNHPSGHLGYKLNHLVKDIMRKNQDIPMVSPDVSIFEALVEMNLKRLGCTIIFNDDNQMVGFFSDGDLRRAVNHQINIHETPIKAVMSPNPKVIPETMSLEQASQLLHQHKILVLPCTDHNQNVTGVLHIHDITQLADT